LKTVAQGISVGSWKTNPISRSVALPEIPADHRTVPELGSARLAMMRRAVDLPQPEGPRRLMNSPSPISRERSFSACVPFEHVFDMSRSGRRGGRSAVSGTLSAPALTDDDAAMLIRIDADVWGGAWKPFYFRNSLPTPLQTNRVV